MTRSTPVLHLMCGKAASGKSTLAATLSQTPNTVVIAEDDWLAALYGDQMTSLSDYVRCSGRLRAVLAPHVVGLLQAGVSVVLDFPANTVETRRWMREIIDQSCATHEMHLLDVPEAVAKARLRARNAGGDHPFAVTEDQFDRLARHFVPPSEDEGFNVVRHRVD